MKKAKSLCALGVIFFLWFLLPAAVRAEPADAEAGSVRVLPDTETWYTDTLASFPAPDSSWDSTLTGPPAGYTEDAGSRTVTLGTADALAWWAGQVNSGASFAGYTVNLTADVDLSAHSWTPVCGTGGALEGTVFLGGGHTIAGLTVREGQDRAAFIGYNDGNLTLEDLTFADAWIAADESSGDCGAAAVVVGTQSGGSLTLRRVTVCRGQVLAPQQVSALAGSLTEGAALTADRCEITDSFLSARTLAAPIVGCGTEAQVTVKGIRLSGNTITAGEAGCCTFDDAAGAQYRCDPRTPDGSSALNACTTALFTDGRTDTGSGHPLDLTAETEDYRYPTLAAAVQAVVNSHSQAGTVTLLRDAAGSGIGLFNKNEASHVALTIDFGGHTYTCRDPAPGCLDTETQGFYLEKGNTVTLKNGTIRVDEESWNTAILLQNYSDLTLQDLNLQGGAFTQYLISCNYGSMVLDNVNADGTAPDLVAIDLMHWLNELYRDQAPAIAIHNTEANTIRGSIDVYCYDDATGAIASDCADKPSLRIYGGNYSTDPTRYLAQEVSLTVRPSKEFYQVKIYDPEIVVSPVPSGTEELQLDMGEDAQQQLTAEAEQIVTEILQGDLPAGVDAETAGKLSATQADPLTVSVEFQEKSTDDLHPAEITAVENTTAANDTLAQFFSLSLVLKDGQEDLGLLTELSTPLCFTLSVPKALVQDSRTFFILRVHNGQSEKLPVEFDADQAALTFSTDRFSTYALGYTDLPVSPSAEPASTSGAASSGMAASREEKAAVPTAPTRQAAPAPAAPVPTAVPAAHISAASIPQTGDNSHPLLWMVLFSLSGAGIAALGFLALWKRKRP
ncbi:LPXTG cell wall anchor domain-containing protein [Subdoligranulum variabile]|uniref:LPXTG cell wall anchor domain-containing protein n=1 Tax=Subdoligranulum variabile TaxID=214851 RepID=UPI000593FA71|nr:LPXTG cell wall anchor domain-containing protein [Subdoligranulum variabile]UWP67292.1 LPXTG cell wall anchor domain-containing protein [Subdoligranulum variabile]